MLTFKQYLTEIKQRSPQMAAQLLDRVSRLKQFGAGEVEGSIKTLVRRSKDNYGGGAYTPERLHLARNKQYYPNTIDSSQFKYSHRDYIPLNKLETAQDRILIQGVMYQLLTTRPSAKIPKVFYIDGRYVIRDGNHRVAAAKLKKEPHILADVYVPTNMVYYPSAARVM
jgi:hypothetical protein